MKLKSTYNSWRSKVKWYFDRTFSEKGTSQIAWLVGIITVVFILIWAFSYPFSEKLFEDSTPSMSRPIRIISLLINPGAVSEVNPTMRIFAILVAVIGIIVLSGFLITVLSNMLERHVEHYRNGDIHYRLKNHIIIIGFNEHTISLIKRLLSEIATKDRILLVSGVPSSNVRERIEAQFSRNIWKQIIYYSEDTSSYESIAMLDSDKAKSIYLIGDNEGNDNLNILTLENLLKINSYRQAPIISCYLFLNSSSTNFILKQKGLTKEWGKTIRVIPINIAENWAKKILIFGEKFGYTPIKLVGSGDKNRLIIVGMTEWGTALSEVFARISHFPVGQLDDSMDKLYYPAYTYIGYSTITFIDQNADVLMDKFCCAYSSLFEIQTYEYIDATQKTTSFHKIGKGGNFLDISFEFVKGSIYCPYVRELLCNATLDNTIIAICSENDASNIEMAVQLPEKIYENQTPVYVRQKYNNVITNIINNKTEYELDNISNKYTNIFSFGMLDNKDVLFDNDDSYVNFIISIYETPKSSSNQIHIRQFERVNKYIENLYHGYYIYLLWEQLKKQYDNITISQILERDMDIFIETEHQRWCVNKLLSGISSTYHENKVFFSNDFIVSFDSLDEEMKQYSAINIEYLKLLMSEKSN